MNALKFYLQSIVAMSGEELSLIDTIAVNIQLSRHSKLLEAGQVCKHVYFVTKGLFRMYYVDNEGNEINRRFTWENGFAVDFQSFLTQQPSQYYITALKDAEVIAIKYTDLQAAYDKSKSWERLGRLMAERGYRQVNERIELMQFRTPEQRYQYIVNTHPELLSRISLAHLSSYLGIRPESLSRLRKRITKNIS